MIDKLYFGPEIGTSIYIHWPYCEKICPYCDFNIFKSKGVQDTHLVESILRDLEFWRPYIEGRVLDSIYFGGGTPSLLAMSHLEAILSQIDQYVTLSSNVEITLEANPSDKNNFEAFKKVGINRLSIGVQSIHDHKLRHLGRNHNAEEAKQAIKEARAVFEKLNIDLIYALYDESIDSWLMELREVLTYSSDHLSLYQLTIEPDTSFGRRERRGEMLGAQEDKAVSFFHSTNDVVHPFGYAPYEISNYAKSERQQSAHNVLGWCGGDYIGVGPGAHGRITIDGRRFATIAPKKIAEYEANVSPMSWKAARATGQITELDPMESFSELIISQLRMTAGVPLTLLHLAQIKDLTAKLEELIALEIVRIDKSYCKLTKDGRLLADAVTKKILS